MENGEDTGFLSEGDPESGEFAFCIFLHALEILRFHELAVRIEVVEHAVQGAIGEIFVAGLRIVNVVLADQLHGPSEDFKLLVGGIRLFGTRGGFPLGRNARKEQC